MNFEEPKPIERAAGNSATGGTGEGMKGTEGKDRAANKTPVTKAATKSENGKEQALRDNAAAQKEAGDANQGKSTSTTRSNEASEKEKTTSKVTDSDRMTADQPATKESTPKNDSADK